MEKKIEQLIDKMTQDQKIGSLLTLGFAGTIPRKHIYEYITKYHCGGLRLSPVFRKFGNYIDPITGEVVVNVEGDGHLKEVAPAYMTASDYKSILDDLQKVAKSRPLSLPLHFSYDQEGGTSGDFNFGGVNLFPKPMGIRATNNPNNAYEVAKAVGKQSMNVGFNYLHSPVLDINCESKNPEIYTRAYSDNVEDVVAYARETCKGLKEVGMIATGKHFPGRGASAVDAHYELPVIPVSLETLYERELEPYRVLIEENLLPSIMMAHSIYPALDSEHVATVSKKIIRDLLRNQMGFKGVITTDSMTMGALATKYGIANACAMALEAGCDLVLMKAENSLVAETFEMIRSFVTDGRISEKDLDDKVRRVLSMKYNYGMFEDVDDRMKSETPESVIEDEAIKSLSRDMAYSSIIPIANLKNLTLPIDKKSKVLVIEQLNKNVANDVHWHYGQLYNECYKLGGNVDYFEIDYRISESDYKEALERAKDYDMVIVTNFYVRSRTANNQFVKELQDQQEGKVIIISNTPYALSVPEGANNVLMSLATTPENLKALAHILFGEGLAKGVWPLKNVEENTYV